MKKDLLLTWISDCTFIRDYAPFWGVTFRSASLSTPTDRVDKEFLTAPDTSQEWMDCVRESSGFVGLVDRQHDAGNKLIRERWKALARRLAEDGGRHRWVCIFDSKDTLFQGDPFEWMDIHLPADQRLLLLTSAGYPHSACDWNTKDQESCRALLSSGRRNWDRSTPVLGTTLVAGTIPEVAQLALTLN